MFFADRMVFFMSVLVGFIHPVGKCWTVFFEW